MSPSFNALGRKMNDVADYGVRAVGDNSRQFPTRLLTSQKSTYGLAMCDETGSQLKPFPLSFV